jgi:hypothetical protein
MVKVFRYKSDLRRFGLLNCDDDAISYLNQVDLDGTPIGGDWRPFRVWWDPTSPANDLGDFPEFPEPVVSGRAVDALGDVLRRHGELLELLSDDGEFCIYNVTDVIGVLDEAASVGDRLAPGRFAWLYKHVFVPARVEGQEIFKIPQLRYGPVVYVTDRFCERVEAAGLRGFAPVEIWSERDGPRWYEGW